MEGPPDSSTTNTPRVFQSMHAAEEAYRQQVDQNRQQLAQFTLLNTKIDSLITTIGALVEALTPRSSTEQLQQSSINPDSNPSTDPNSNSSTDPNSNPPIDPDSDPRREFMERDRSAVPPEITTEIDPIAPISFSSSFSNSRSLTGVKLPRFYGKYTEDINSWITIIEDQFFLHATKEKYKVANISPLLQDDALIWYTWLKAQYRRPITWNEFKQELRTKYADSTVRTSALREKLKTVPYNGPSSVEKYVSKFRSLEQQIATKEMAFGDCFHYFISPFETAFRRAIKQEKPKTMELAYDAAIDWAYIYQDDSGSDSNSEKKQGPPLLQTSAKKKKNDDSDSDIVPDELNKMDM
jgi:Ty3 transposon capsid-like protein